MVLVCSGNPPTSYNQRMYTDFPSLVQKSNVPEDVVDTLRQEALNTGF